MRIVVTDTCYGGFLADHYRSRPGLARMSYDHQMSVLMDRMFGTSDAYTRHLRELGHDAVNLVVNCVPLQLQWAREHSFMQLPVGLSALIPARGQPLVLKSLLGRIALAQIAEFDADVVFVHDLLSLQRADADRLRAEGRSLVGQIASMPPTLEVLKGYDLLLSSFPHFVAWFRREGIDSEHFKLAFYPRVLERLEEVGTPGRPDAERVHPVSFVGGLDPHAHVERIALLERLAERVDLGVWGYGAGSLPPGSPLLARHRGEAWGLDMYRVLATSRITINSHGAISDGYANNMRLYEATGAGAVLLTEAATNLADHLEPGRECVAYEGVDDLVEKATYLLENDDERLRIAAAGQARTLAEHTYAHRMTKLAGLISERGLDRRS